MLTRLTAKGYKSLVDVDVSLPRLTVLFGPNSVGKSNVLDALVVLSRLASERTVADALSDPVRGYPFEQVTLPHGGLPELLRAEKKAFYLGVDLIAGAGEKYRYSVAIEVSPSSGRASVQEEELVLLSKEGTPRGTPAISTVGSELRVRRKGKPAHPRIEQPGLDHTQLSDKRWSGEEYGWIEKTRAELSGFRTYYLDPRVSMRQDVPPTEVLDIGPLGESLAPFLYRLKSSRPKHFAAVLRALRTIVPTVEDLQVDLDERRGLLGIQIRQDGTWFSSRVISEGTLRVVALCAIAANPWPGSLVAFEEPENGVHPRRLELVAKLLTTMALRQGRQVIVTSHSPLFCQQMLDVKREFQDMVDLLVVTRRHGETNCTRFEALRGPLFNDAEIRESLLGSEDTHWFEELVLQGFVDA